MDFKKQIQTKILTKGPDYVPGLGWEVDLDETTCTPKTLARLSMSSEEMEMSDDEWEALYAKRVAEGFYEKQNQINDEDLPF